ncbi:hypothetical protein IT575_11490 [bacterium]|nr:hypothetical protein [bacterium]
MDKAEQSIGSQSDHPAAPGRRARLRILWATGLVLSVLALLLCYPAELERYQRRDSKEYLHTLQLRLEIWAISQPHKGTVILEHYPRSLAELSWDSNLAERSDKDNSNWKEVFLSRPPRNWHTKRAVRDVTVNQPAAGEISYLPLRGSATLPDGTVVEDVYGYALFLWGGRRLRQDALLIGPGLEQPVAMLLDGYGDSRNPPGTVLPDRVQSVEEALAVYDLKLVREP